MIKTLTKSQPPSVAVTELLIRLKSAGLSECYEIRNKLLSVIELKESLFEFYLQMASWEFYRPGIHAINSETLLLNKLLFIKNFFPEIQIKQVVNFVDQTINYNFNL